MGASAAEALTEAGDEKAAEAGAISGEKSALGELELEFEFEGDVKVGAAN